MGRKPETQRWRGLHGEIAAFFAPKWSDKFTARTKMVRAGG
jgi:hypothetical protein